MKELISFIISIIILIILFDMFCSNTRLTGFIKFAFSSLIVFTAMSFLMNMITKVSAFDRISQESIENNSVMVEEQVIYLEDIIKTRIEIEKSKESDVEIEYQIDENGAIQYLSINVYLVDCSTEEREEIEKIVQEYLDCQVNVYV